MAISAIVIKLGGKLSEMGVVMESLAKDRRVTLGEPREGRIPAVVATESSSEDRAAFEEIASIPGVDAIELVGVHFDAPEEAGQEEG